jgi:hypothetical protein
MKPHYLIGLGILALSILLLKESRRKRAKPIVKNVIVNPTAIFIWQSSSKRPTIDLYRS